MPASDDMTCVTRKAGNRHTTRHDQRESPAREPARQNRYTDPLHTASAERSHTFSRNWLDNGGLKGDSGEVQLHYTESAPREVLLPSGPPDRLFESRLCTLLRPPTLGCLDRQ